MSNIRDTLVELLAYVDVARGELSAYSEHDTVPQDAAAMARVALDKAADLAAQLVKEIS